MVEIAFTYLRDAILEGDLPPGHKLAQAALASELGISRMPLREALRKLEERGFVTIVAHRGAFVTSISADDVKELYLIRTNLEAINARAAAEAMDEQRVARLRQILGDARAALAAGDGMRLAESNRAFHLVGHEASGYQVLNRLISDLSDHCNRYRLVHATLAQRSQQALHEHERVLEAWATGDGEAAARSIRVNLLNSEAALLEAIERAEKGAHLRGRSDG